MSGGCSSRLAACYGGCMPSGRRQDDFRPTYVPEAVIRAAESLDVLNLILAGQEVSPRDLWKLTEEHVEHLWYWADPDVHLSRLAAQLVAASLTIEAFEQAIYPKRAALIRAGRRPASVMPSPLHQSPLLRSGPWRFGEPEQFRFWVYRNPEVDAGIEPHMLVEQGMSWDVAAKTIYPLRWLLLECVGGDELALAAYVEAMEQKVQEVEQARAQAEQARIRARSSIRDALGLVPSDAPVSEPANAFRREGSRWLITFEGRPERMVNLNGLVMIAHLLGRPWQPVHAHELVRLIHPLDPGA